MSNYFYIVMHCVVCVFEHFNKFNESLNFQVCCMWKPCLQFSARGSGASYKAPRGNTKKKKKKGKNVFPLHQTFDLTPPNHFLQIIQYVHLRTALSSLCLPRGAAGADVVLSVQSDDSRR